MQVNVLQEAPIAASVCIGFQKTLSRIYSSPYFLVYFLSYTHPNELFMFHYSLSSFIRLYSTSSFFIMPWLLQIPEFEGYFNIIIY